MDSIIEFIVDFVKVRQLNIAEEPSLKTTSTFGWVAVILTTVYIIYQYWGVKKGEVPCQERESRSRSRSEARTRSRSRSYYKQIETNLKSQRGRKQYRRCPNCSLCDFEQ